MFKQIFQSNVVPYRLPNDWAGVPTGIGLQSLYHPELVTPPRGYAEEIDRIDGMYTSKVSTANSQSTITIIGWTRRIYWPGWDRLYWRFDATTGVFIERGPNLASYYDYNVYQSTDGSVWRVRIGGSFVQIDPQTTEALAGTAREPSEFGVAAVYLPLVDRMNNLLIAATSRHLGQPMISVFNWTTGAHIREIRVSGPPINLMPEDGHRCWVVSDNGILNLVDYMTGQVLSALKDPLPLGNGVTYSWDLFTRRLLAFHQIADATDGACLSRVTGYYPVPIPVKITAPIPLRAVRAGRKTSVLCRTYGDTGEGLSAGKLGVTVAGNGVLAAAIPSPDSTGYTTFQVSGLAAGSVGINLSLEVL